MTITPVLCTAPRGRVVSPMTSELGPRDTWSMCGLGDAQRPHGQQAPPETPAPEAPQAPGEAPPASAPGKGGRPKASPQAAIESVKQFGEPSVAVSPASRIHVMTIVGQVEGHIVLPPQNKSTKYEHVLPQLVAIEQNPEVKGVLVLLNTVGGDVEAGLAIAEMLSSMSKPTVSLVLGGGHSIAVPIAIACRYSFIAETATMTIHPLRLSGLVIGVPQTYEYLDKMQDRVIRFVTKHSKIEEEKFRELMFRTGELVRDVGTVLVGKDAVEVGLIDEVGGLNKALAKLDELIAENEKHRDGAQRRRGRRRGADLQ